MPFTFVVQFYGHLFVKTVTVASQIIIIIILLYLRCVLVRVALAMIEQLRNDERKIIKPKRKEKMTKTKGQSNEKQNDDGEKKMKRPSRLNERP